MSRKDAIIVDIDGTLSDPNHRRHHVQGDSNEWEKFFKKVDEDPVNQWCKKVIDKFKDDHMVLLVTGRPEKSKDGVPVNRKTRDWLYSHNIFFDNIIMRPEGDFREDVVVKKEILEEKLPEPDNILFAVDDRDDIAEMWRENGITCLQCKDEVTTSE